jgi:hypothetical protein
VGERRLQLAMRSVLEAEKQSFHSSRNCRTRLAPEAVSLGLARHKFRFMKMLLHVRETNSRQRDKSVNAFNAVDRHSDKVSCDRNLLIQIVAAESDRVFFESYARATWRSGTDTPLAEILFTARVDLVPMNERWPCDNFEPSTSWDRVYSSFVNDGGSGLPFRMPAS